MRTWCCCIMHANMNSRRVQNRGSFGDQRWKNVPSRCDVGNENGEGRKGVAEGGVTFSMGTAMDSAGKKKGRRGANRRSERPPGQSIHESMGRVESPGSDMAWSPMGVDVSDCFSSLKLDMDTSAAAAAAQGGTTERYGGSESVRRPSSSGRRRREGGKTRMSRGLGGIAVLREDGHAVPVMMGGRQSGDGYSVGAQKGECAAAPKHTMSGVKVTQSKIVVEGGNFLHQRRRRVTLCSKGAGTAAVQGAGSGQSDARQTEKQDPIAVANKLRNIGNDYFKKQDFQASCTNYSGAIHALRSIPVQGQTAKEGLALLYCNRAAAYLALGKPVEALKDCKQGKEIHPLFLKCSLRAATCFLRMGNLKKPKKNSPRFKSSKEYRRSYKKSRERKVPSMIACESLKIFQ